MYYCATFEPCKETEESKGTSDDCSIYLVVDEERSMTGSKRELIGLLQSRFWLLGNRLIYEFAGNGYAPSS
jgi:hypothetical protein